MPTFKRIEIVDARPYTGGAQNGTDLLLWVHSNSGKAEWIHEYNPSTPSARRGLSREHIRLYDMPYSHIFETAYVGDWLMLRASGKFEVVRQQELDADYEQV